MHDGEDEDAIERHPRAAHAIAHQRLALLYFAKESGEADEGPDHKHHDDGEDE